MRLIARIFVFSAALTLGVTVASLFSVLTSAGLSDCVINFSPEPVTSSPTPKGVHVVYAGWQPESDERVASLRLVVHNGLDVPIFYSAFTPTDAIPEIRINGKKREKWICQNGIREYHIAPGASAEIHADRWYFPPQITKKDEATVGLHFNLFPRNTRPESKRPEIFAVTKPFLIPEAFLMQRRP